MGRFTQPELDALGVRLRDADRPSDGVERCVPTIAETGDLVDAFHWQLDEFKASERSGPS